MCSISAAVIVFALLLAFNRSVRSVALGAWEIVNKMTVKRKAKRRQKDGVDSVPVAEFEDEEQRRGWLAGVKGWVGKAGEKRSRSGEGDLERGRTRVRQTYDGGGGGKVGNGEVKEGTAASLSKFWADNRVKAD